MEEDTDREGWTNGRFATTAGLKQIQRSHVAAWAVLQRAQVRCWEGRGMARRLGEGRGRSGTCACAIGALMPADVRESAPINTFKEEIYG